MYETQHTLEEEIARAPETNENGPETGTDSETDATESGEDKGKKITGKLKLIEAWLNSKYFWRYNTLKKKVQYMPVNGGRWLDLNDYLRNSMVREMIMDGIDVNKQYIDVLVESNFSESVNPIEEYFDNLQYWDGHDYITELAETVRLTKVEEQQVFPKLLKKFLVAVIANAFDKKACKNHVMLVLTGGQGAFKSTWLRGLCPSSLRDDYYYEGMLEPDKKDHLFKTTYCLLVNIDDYLNNINSKKVEALKNLITLPDVNDRRAYARYEEHLPKIASFIASCNDKQFLYDDSGSRRFLAFEVDKILIEKAQKINMDKVYSQAFHFYKSNMQYWLTKEEEQALQERNSAFEIQSQEMEMAMAHFEPYDERETSHVLQCMTGTEIKLYLEGFSKKELSPKRLGAALAKLGYRRENKTLDTGQRSWVYLVHKKYRFPD